MDPVSMQTLFELSSRGKCVKLRQWNRRVPGEYVRDVDCPSMSLLEDDRMEVRDLILDHHNGAFRLGTWGI